jgi:sugar/nucleoside kinase (ribokinase family)
VGADPVADSLLGLLQREGVDTAGLVRKSGVQTSASVIPVRPNGDRPAWHCIGANGAFTLDDLDLGSLEGSSHVHLGGPEFLSGEAAGRLLAHARSIGARTSVDMLAPGDPGILEWVVDCLPYADYVLPNDEQVIGLTGAETVEDGARALLEKGAGCVAVTQGAKGAIVVTEDETVEVPAYPIDVVDTTGCGDAFSAGFLRGLSLGRDLRGAARLGCATAAHVAQGLGTDHGAYTLSDVEALERRTRG